MRPSALRPTFSRLCAAAIASAAIATPLHAVTQCGNEVVFDLSPFTPAGVAGEIFGVASVEGVVTHARIDATFVSEQEGPWSMFANFSFPTGLAGVSSETQGWSGTGTFSTTIETDALNGYLVLPAASPFYSWFLLYSAAAPIETMGKFIALGPMDGYFQQLTLTLTLDDCPTGDLDGDISVGFNDLLILLSAWGDCPEGETCAADFDNDGSVGFSDLLTLLSAWGDDYWGPPPFC